MRKDTVLKASPSAFGGVRSSVRTQAPASYDSIKGWEGFLRYLFILNYHPARFKKDFVFHNTHGGPCLDADIFNQTWKVALKASGAEYRIAYNYRPTYASLALTAGVNPAFIANQLGHGLDMTLTVYGKYINSDNDKLELARVEGKNN